MKCAATGKIIYYKPQEREHVKPFRRAAHEMIRNGRWRRLCHGLAVVPGRRGTLVQKAYAWVEAGGLAFDPTTGTVLPLVQFYKSFRINRSETAFFTRRGMWMKFRQTRRYNRWIEL